MKTVDGESADVEEAEAPAVVREDDGGIAGGGALRRTGLPAWWREW